MNSPVDWYFANLKQSSNEKINVTISRDYFNISKNARLIQSLNQLQYMVYNQYHLSKPSSVVSASNEYFIVDIYYSKSNDSSVYKIFRIQDEKRIFVMSIDTKMKLAIISRKWSNFISNINDKEPIFVLDNGNIYSYNLKCERVESYKYKKFSYTLNLTPTNTSLINMAIIRPEMREKFLSIGSNKFATALYKIMTNEIDEVFTKKVINSKNNPKYFSWDTKIFDPFIIINKTYNLFMISFSTKENNAVDMYVVINTNEENLSSKLRKKALSEFMFLEDIKTYGSLVKY